MDLVQWNVIPKKIKEQVCCHFLTTTWWLQQHLVLMKLTSFSSFSSIPHQRYLDLFLITESKSVVVIIPPYYPPDPTGLQCEQYCHLFLMKHEPFCQLSDILAGKDTYVEAYRIYLQSDSILSSLADDIYRL